MKVLLLLTMLIALIVASPAAATTYYVDDCGSPQCSDSNNGLSATYSSGTNGPFATLQHANSVIASGDTVEVEDGAYTGTLNITDSNAKFETYLGAKATLDAQNGSTGGNPSAVYINASGVTWSGIRVINSGGVGIWLNQASITVKNSDVDHSADGGISAHSAADGSIISHNEVWANNQGTGGGTGCSGGDEEGITVSGADDVTTDHNIVHDNCEEGIDYKNRATGEIADNYSINNTLDIYLDQAGNSSGTTLLVHDNIVSETSSTSGHAEALTIGNEGAFGTVATENVDVYNNLIYSAAGAMDVSACCSFPTGTVAFRDIDIYNNTTYMNSDASHTLPDGINFDGGGYGSSAYGGTINVKNNLFWEASDPVDTNPNTSVVQIDYNLCKSGQSCPGSNSVTAVNDPTVGGLTTTDPYPWFNLKSGSIAVNNGIVEGPATTDVDGVIRGTCTDCYDIGAYELKLSRPSRVTGLSVTHTGSNNVLSWTDVSDESQYRVYARRVHEQGWYAKPDLAQNTTTVSYPATHSGVTYEYYVRALDSSDRGGQPSGTVQVTVP